MSHALTAATPLKGAKNFYRHRLKGAPPGVYEDGGEGEEGEKVPREYKRPGCSRKCQGFWRRTFEAAAGAFPMLLACVGSCPSTLLQERNLLLDSSRGGWCLYTADHVEPSRFCCGFLMMAGQTAWCRKESRQASSLPSTLTLSACRVWA